MLLEIFSILLRLGAHTYCSSMCTEKENKIIQYISSFFRGLWLLVFTVCEYHYSGVASKCKAKFA